MSELEKWDRLLDAATRMKTQQMFVDALGLANRPHDLQKQIEQSARYTIEYDLLTELTRQYEARKREWIEAGCPKADAAPEPHQAAPAAPE